MGGCKRAFADFAAPLSPFKPRKESVVTPTAPDLPVSVDANDNVGESSPMIPPATTYNQNRGPSIADHIAAGSDFADIMTRISSLTNEIHPIFRDKNLCLCQYLECQCCIRPYYATYRGEDLGMTKSPPTDSPYPKDNPVVRAILQLATNIITHSDALPFWAGIIECGLSEDPTNVFRVHPRKHLSPEREKATLWHLRQLAHHIRIHFVLFDNDLQGLQTTFHIEDDDPDYDHTRDRRFCHPDGYCSAECNNAVYGYKNGKPAIVNYPFPHIYMNTAHMYGINMSDLLYMTITEAKECTFQSAVTLSHEVSHALMELYNTGRPPALMNDEPIAETGMSLETHLFGGIVNHVAEKISHVSQWPSVGYWDYYNKNDFPMPINAFGKLPWSRVWRADAERVSRFTDQSFWDEKGTGGYYKKMWLRPYHEKARKLEEYENFASGHESPAEMSRSKRRRLSVSGIERRRAWVANAKWKLAMKRKDRWYRWKENSQQRSEERLERCKDRLDAFWTSVTRHFDEEVFLKR